MVMINKYILLLFKFEHNALVQQLIMLAAWILRILNKVLVLMTLI